VRAKTVLLTEYAQPTQHHAPIEKVKVPAHLKYVPDYLVPKAMKAATGPIGKAQSQLRGKVLPRSRKHRPHFAQHSSPNNPG
jgi:hypothetical protein